MKERNKAVVASYLILKKEDEILLMRRMGSGYYDGWYSVPAGHVEVGELPTEALIRETKEEIGIVLQKGQLRHVHTMYRTKHDETGDRADYFFLATDWSGEPEICEPNKCDDIKWCTIDTLPENVMHHVKDALGYIEKGIDYSELSLKDITKNPTGGF
ncbi:NUDIX domain-containing protein [Patescibacteria group bacterium]|nr:NUDIX domain-containing protein [Patescibacteria group bacterium]